MILYEDGAEPEWNAVFMLSGAVETSATAYLQIIFRAQSAHTVDGRVKERCYVFDFAPDRMLNMAVAAASASSKCGYTANVVRENLKEFMNFCPVIAMDGSRMKELDPEMVFQHVKRRYADIVAQNGFDHPAIFNTRAFATMDAEALTMFRNLKTIVGHSSGQPNKKDNIPVNAEGLTDAEYNIINSGTSKEISTQLKKKADDNKKWQRIAMDALRAIAVRIPLMVYGAEKIDIDTDFTPEMLADPNIVDDESWEDFMPGVTREMYLELVRYFDRDVFIAAAKRIRSTIYEADKLPPLRGQLARIDLISTFKNPNKETVLTPPGVVERQYALLANGWSFYDETFDKPNTIETTDENGKTITRNFPRYVDNGSIPQANDIWKQGNTVLDLNSKTGLYSLYALTNKYIHSNPDALMELQKDDAEDNGSYDDEYAFWDSCAVDIYAIAQSPMAKSFIRHTLFGYRHEDDEFDANIRYMPSMIELLKVAPELIAARLEEPAYWTDGCWDHDAESQQTEMVLKKKKWDGKSLYGVKTLDLPKKCVKLANENHKNESAAPKQESTMNDENGKVHFDYIICNPPYQESSNKSTADTHGDADPVYNLFIDLGMKMSD